jgi:hypothetical protein
MLRYNRRAFALCGEAPATKNRLGIAPRPPNFHARPKRKCRAGSDRMATTCPEHCKTVRFHAFVPWLDFAVATAGRLNPRLTC